LRRAVEIGVDFYLSCDGKTVFLGKRGEFVEYEM
jgi:hypothetical protein